MGKDTKIQWANHTFSPWWGCSKCSPACEHCYAERLASRFGVKWGPTDPRKVFDDRHWDEPLRWDRSAARKGVRRRVFLMSMGDIFENRIDLVPHRGRAWDLVAKTKNLDWMLLTKRPENIEELSPKGGLPENVWLGVTAESQEWLDLRVAQIRNVKASVKWVSVEPMLGPISPESLDDISLVVVGGETGPWARPSSLDDMTKLVEGCKKRGVAVFVKQMGCALAKSLGLKDQKGADPEEWPESLRVRQFPFSLGG